MSDKQVTCPLCGHEMTAIETEELTFLADNSEIVRIKNENNNLRAARDMAVEDAKSIIVKLSTTRAENAKLRELVREIWRSCPVSEDDCAKCPHRLEESDEVWCDIPILMEKLGVEVDG